MALKITKWDGEKITKPGVYADVPLAVYHSQAICAGPSVSSSGLRRVLERNGGSPAHFFDEWSGNPDCQEGEEEKRHFIVGRAVHHLLLGEVGFAKAFVVRPDEVPDRLTGIMRPWQGNRLECRCWTTDSTKPLGGLPTGNFGPWFEQHRPAGRAILTKEDIEDIKGMAVSIGSHPEVNIQFRPGRYYSLLNGHIEKSFFWQDKATKLWLKARPDAIPTDSGDYADLKTTTSVAYLPLLRTITDYAYHQQAALIGEGSAVCASIPLSSYTLVFVEKKRPWCVRPVPLKPEDIEVGAKQNRLALDLIARCIRDKRWPGPGNGHIISIPLTDYYRKEAERDIEEAKEGRAA